MEELRENLYKLIDKYGLSYEKVIEADIKLHQEINKKMKREV